MTSFVFNILDKILAFLIGISLLTGFIVNIFYAITLRDSSYIGKATIELGKSFLSPQNTIMGIVQNFPTENTIFAYFIIFIYSFVTLFYLSIIWKLVSAVWGRGVNVQDPPKFMMALITLIIYWIITNLASYYTSGTLMLNPFVGWTEIAFHPQVLLNMANKYLPANVSV